FILHECMQHPTSPILPYTTLFRSHAGEVQVESIYVSVDPYMRGRMNDTKSYVQPFQVNEPLQGHIVGKVTQSNDERLSVDCVTLDRKSTRLNSSHVSISYAVFCLK